MSARNLTDIQVDLLKRATREVDPREGPGTDKNVVIFEAAAAIIEALQIIARVLKDEIRAAGIQAAGPQ